MASMTSAGSGPTTEASSLKSPASGSNCGITRSAAGQDLHRGPIESWLPKRCPPTRTRSSRAERPRLSRQAEQSRNPANEQRAPSATKTPDQRGSVASSVSRLASHRERVRLSRKLAVSIPVATWQIGVGRCDGLFRSRPAAAVAPVTAVRQPLSLARPGSSSDS